MREYYIRIATYGEARPHIVSEEVIYQAERGLNDLNPDDFMFLCEADCIADAREQYQEEISRLDNDRIAERYHP